MTGEKISVTTIGHEVVGMVHDRPVMIELSRGFLC